MREADRQDAPFTVIVGDHELESGRVQVKDMASGEQVEVAFDDLAQHLMQRPSVASSVE
jgi:histidyl-tRNA synthetase